MERVKKIKEILEEYGFNETEENHFLYENVSHKTININGKINKREVRNTIEVVYTGTGGTMDGDTCLNDMLFFNIFSNGKFTITVGAYSFNEIAEVLNIKWSEDSK